MSRIQSCFQSLRGANHKALIPYLTAGAPESRWTVPVMHALVDAGADIIELGMPFSDPMADGPVIQQACERALSQGVRLEQVLAMAREFRGSDPRTPLVLMGYLNPVEQFGFQAFCEACAEAEIDGLLMVDLPPEEGDRYADDLTERRLDIIRLVSPTTPEQRMARICQAASGFVYYVALKGVTGAGNLDTDTIAGRIAALRRQTDLPVGVGFGIADARNARAVARNADAVIVGSALVRSLLEAQSEGDACQKVRAFIAPLRRALNDIGGSAPGQPGIMRNLQNKHL